MTETNMQTPPGSFGVRQHEYLPAELTLDCWHLYLGAFTDLNRLAAQRHLMTPTEFNDVCSDPRITKYIAVRGDGAVAGMSVMTNDLSAWPLIAEPYFQHHWPVQYAAREIWYLGFACVEHPGHDGHVFEKLIEVMAEAPRAAHGLVFMDFCTANVARLIRGIRRTVARLDPEHTFHLYDSQQFWGFDFRTPSSMRGIDV